MSSHLVKFIRDYYATREFIPLHAPVFSGNERKYVLDAIDSTFVSSIGAYVDKLEADIAAYTGAVNAVATVNGTSALHVSLLLAGVQADDLVITQPLTFVATCNAISYCNAQPVFVDVDLQTLSLSSAALEGWLIENAIIDSAGLCRNRKNNKVIRACLVMHTFGHPADLDGLTRVTHDWNITLIEDAAESLGSFYKGQHTGTFGALGTLSFNGNKLITTGGGGIILGDEEFGKRAKHLTTTAKKPHLYEFVHDEIGYNYRLPNLNAALGCAQLEQLEAFIAAKRVLAAAYQYQLLDTDFQFISEPENCRSNYWLNAVICEDKVHRDALLRETNEQGIMTRPIWVLMNHLSIYQNCLCGDLSNAEWLEARVVNLPSSVVIKRPS
jgi:aminotransferase in exopolysaccharide biosynthesis